METGGNGHLGGKMINHFKNNKQTKDHFNHGGERGRVPSLTQATSQ